MTASRQERAAGRPAQRRRTRTALLAAAARLLAEGRALPTLAEVAAAADISRRTAYRYFPTAEQLATEAVLETLAPHLDPAMDQVIGSADVAARVSATVRRMQEAAIANEPLLRTMIRLTIDRPPAADGGRAPSSRGSRRVQWLGEAIRPVRRSLDKRSYERLLSALCLCVGAEALIALRDARGLSTAATVDVCVWTADALVRAALGDGSVATGSSRSRPPSPPRA
jgi:AcrR family transcriptional regulator